MAAECHECHLLIEPDERVVQAVELVAGTLQGDQTKRWFEGRTIVVHERHWPPEARRWRWTYRGPLSGVPPA
jgi:hypothetical protein